MHSRKPKHHHFLRLGLMRQRHCSQERDTSDFDFLHLDPLTSHYDTRRTKTLLAPSAGPCSVCQRVPVRGCAIRCRHITIYKLNKQIKLDKLNKQILMRYRARTVSVHLMPGVGSCPAEHHERSSETRLYSHVQ
jgi:hypothetical protein